jgi:3-deoxy-D-manno-octulosonic-acid transferase
MLPALYRGVTAAVGPFVRIGLEWRCRRGKEDPARLRERLGFASGERPAGPLVWVHAASVGEATSVLALIERLLRERPGLNVLITTGTVASARLIEMRLPPRARHHYVPVDLPSAVDRFLDHWQPGLAVWVESELWPNLVLSTHRRGIPMALVNARLSSRSYARWRARPSLARRMLAGFTLCLAQDGVQAQRFRDLGAAATDSVGDLKAVAEALPADPGLVADLRRDVGDRPMWLAASTHPGEEEVIAAAHRRIARDHPGLLTIIVPRHPLRSSSILGKLCDLGLTVAQRSAAQAVAAETDIYLADTLGELGVFYRLAGIAFVGGSLGNFGGHNPFEAARLDCAILHGPDMANCRAMADALVAAGGATIAGDAGAIAAAVSRLLADPAARDRQAAAAARTAAASLGTLDAVLARLAPFLDALAPLAVESPLPSPALRRADARS